MPKLDQILLVEDHANTAALFQILTARAYTALIAENGQRALDLFDQGIRPRLVLVRRSRRAIGFGRAVSAGAGINDRRIVVLP